MEPTLFYAKKLMGGPLFPEQFKTNENVLHLLNGWKKRVTQKKDVAVCITGDEGESKSTLQNLLSMALDPWSFTFSRNILYDPSVGVLHDMIYNLPEETPVGIDEAVRVAFSKWWNTRGNKLLAELYVLCRNQRKISFFCIPRFRMLDSDMRRRVIFWIHCFERGKAIVMRKDKNQASSDPWHLDDLEKVIDDKLKNLKTFEVSFEEYARATSFSKNYVGMFSFE